MRLPPAVTAALPRRRPEVFSARHSIRLFLLCRSRSLSTEYQGRSLKGQHWADIYEWLHNNVPNHNAVFCRFFPPRRHRQTKSRKYQRNWCTVLQADCRIIRYTPLFRRWVRACPKAINICRA